MNNDNVYEYDNANEEQNTTQLDVDSLVDDYLDDDEQFLAGDDVVVSESDALSLFKQTDNVVSYEVLNFYDDNGKPRNRLSLRNDPPILHISSSDGQSADFVLTKNFTSGTARMLRDVERAYVGMSPKKSADEKKTFRSRVDDVKSWAKANKAKAIMLGVLAVLFVGYIVSVSF